MTTPTENLEARLAAITARLDLVDGAGGMLDTSRRVVAAEKLKIETDSNQPQVIEPTEDGGGLALGNDGSWRIIDALTEPVSHTGDLIQTTIHTTKLEANSMGPNGVVRLSSIWRATVGGGGVWNAYMYFAGAQVARTAFGVQQAVDCRPIKIWNKNDANAQSYVQSTMLMNQHSGNSAISNATIDTTADVDITFQVTCGNVLHVVTLAFALVEVQYRP